MAKGFAAAVFLGIFLVFRIGAAEVSFLVIETGLPQEDGKKQYSGICENALMDVFFESGHIVSNAPLKRLNFGPSGEIQREAAPEMEEAVRGGAEFFIVAVLDYKSGESIPGNISLILYRLKPYKKIFEERFAGKRTGTVKEDFENLKRMSSGLVPRLNDR
jgi:hypothetical protein